MKIKALIVDLIGVAGLGLLGFGVWILSPPCSFIVIGTLMIIFAVRSKV